MELKKTVRFVESVTKNMNEPGGYEWLRGEGAREVLLIDDCSDSAPEHLQEQHAFNVTIGKGQNFTV